MQERLERTAEATEVDQPTFGGGQPVGIRTAEVRAKLGGIGGWGGQEVGVAAISASVPSRPNGDARSALAGSRHAHTPEDDNDTRHRETYFRRSA